jgi:hypothetical protein
MVPKVFECRFVICKVTVSLEDSGICEYLFYPMPEISDFQHTNSELAKSDQRYPVKITLEYAH